MKEALLKEFGKNKYPDDSTKATIASNIGLTNQQVKYWFDSRRRKFKKIQLKSSNN